MTLALEARRQLEDLRDSAEFTSADAPDDDEPLTSEGVAALDEAREDVRANREVTHGEARRVLLGDG